MAALTSTASTLRAPACTKRGTTTPGPQPASTTTPATMTSRTAAMVTSSTRCAAASYVWRYTSADTSQREARAGASLEIGAAEGVGCDGVRLIQQPICNCHAKLVQTKVL